MATNTLHEDFMKDYFYGSYSNSNGESTSTLTMEKILEAKEMLDKIINQNPVPPLFPIQVITSPYAIEHKQVRFPRSKKARIKKKWAKMSSNFKDCPACYLCQGKIIAHPEYYNKIIKIGNIKP